MVDSRCQLINVPPRLALTLSQFVGVFVKDVVLTPDEVEGLMAGLLVSNDPPRGQKSLREWLQENKDFLGVHYASELARHYKG